MDKTILSRESPIFRPWFFNYDGKEYELSRIKLYNQGIVEFETMQGWLSEDNYYSSDVWSLTIPLVKKAMKEDLHRKDCYFIKDNERSFRKRAGGRSPRYIMYINTAAAGITVTKGKTTKSWKTPTEQGYHTEIIISGLDGRFENTECTQIITHIHSHNEPTKDAEHINTVQKRLEKIFSHVSTYDVEKFLKEFKEVK